MYFIDTLYSWGHYSIVASLQEPPPFKVDLYVYSRYKNSALLVETMGAAHSLAAHHVCANTCHLFPPFFFSFIIHRCAH
jgi:hypothetical protein